MVLATNAINTLNSTITSCTTPKWPYWHSSIARFENCYMCVAGSLNTVNATCSNTYHDSVMSNAIMWPQWHSSIVMTEDEYIIAVETERARILLEQERLREQRARRESIYIEEQKITQEKAKQILLEHLTPDQKDVVEKHGWFMIEGGKSKKKYKIKTDRYAGNVEELDEKGVVIAKYCCHLSHSYPSPDHHLTQKLMLEWDEEEFLRRANKTNVA